jgi:hypothetical protein
LARFIPLLLAGECEAAKKIQFRRLALGALRQLCRFSPLPGVKGFLRGGKARGVQWNLLR